MAADFERLRGEGRELPGDPDRRIVDMNATRRAVGTAAFLALLTEGATLPGVPSFVTELLTANRSPHGIEG